MIEELKPYESYRSLGLRWADRIPSHWGCDRAGSCLQKLNLRSPNGREELLTVSSAHGVVPRKTATVTMFKAKSYAGYKLCWPDDLVINSLWAWAGGLGVSRHHGIVSSAYGVYRFRPSSKLVPRYLHELVRSAPFNWELQVRSKGIWISRLQLSDDAFLSAPVLVPPSDEQAAIIRFLDHANRRTDQFIRAKKKLIALLNEQKQAIIHRAVTRGLDRSVKLKDSGVPWLDHIPAHWALAKIKHHISTIEQGWSPQCDAQSVETFDEWAVLKVGCVNKDVFSPHQNKKLPLALQPRPQLAVRQGDILMSRANTPSLVGLVALVDRPYPRLMISDKHYRFRGRADRVDDEFLVLALRSSPTRAQIESATNGASSSMQNISQQLVGNLLVALPGLGEQRLIRAEVASSTAGLRRTIASTEQELALVCEYRTRLISDVVTGQLDVRTAAASLDIEPEAVPAEPSDADDADIEDEEAA